MMLDKSFLMLNKIKAVGLRCEWSNLFCRIVVQGRMTA